MSTLAHQQVALLPETCIILRYFRVAYTRVVDSVSREPFIR